MEDVTLQALLSEIRDEQRRLGERVGHLEANVGEALSRLIAIQDGHGSRVDDHESRIREIESAIPRLLTVESAAEDAAARQRKFYAIGGLVVPFFVVVLSTLLAYLVARWT